jgi:hypothetical protein
MTCEKVLEALKVFSFRDWQNFETFLLTLEREEISLEDFRACLKEQKPSLAVKRKQPDVEPQRFCPECNGELILEGICAKKGKLNKFGWKTLWSCSRCPWYEYSLLTREQQLEVLRRKANGTR